ncbi:hypothetical protein D7Y13_20170 [Corallococcus praedator]|uniref:Immunity MXAN-0049 protein domain-containing protein n=1 Tax=Corallococcus praedator TaxID=2316724 RepID=A0ABX9QFX7_9BACT|nr:MULTISPECIES: DUF1629 domain-containing protein [Corallococcus]RKH12113.1 hypothetical protein D7X74_24195 [Corallococcus sp. CA047B]RKH26921.1 hypothetical protein D7X75_27475 [Corallococcus sp. CA031C]RKI06454.1 hypothetical protein D7Y13_20170 [Corallococcus praedator]
MSKSSYSILRAIEDPSLCGILSLPDELYPLSWKLAEGRSVAKQYPPDVQFKMTDRYPGILVPDFIQNVVACTLVSEAAKALLEQHARADIEFLPFTLRNHKGRIARERCFIANILGVVDCVDPASTRATPSKMEKGTYLFLNKLGLDMKKVPETARIMRLKQLPSVMIVHEALRAVLQAEGMTGLGFIEIGEECDIRE